MENLSDIELRHVLTEQLCDELDKMKIPVDY